MTSHSVSGLMRRPSPFLILLLVLLAVVWLAGGASRADTYGQVVVRAAASGILLAGALIAPRPDLRDARPVAVLLGASILLAAVQLTPFFARPASAGDNLEPLRPWWAVSGATLNAFFSLTVPLAVLLLWTAVRPIERCILPGAMLVLIAASTVLGLLQFSGSGLNSPLVNGAPGQVSATFANRNHFALFVAAGFVLAPAWAFLGGRRPSWRGPVALGLLPLFALAILASGSRAGLVVGIIGLTAGLIIAWRPLGRDLRRYPRWVPAALIAAFLGMVLALVALSVAADRAISINRMLSVEMGQDMRQRGLPTVIAMVQTYFPMGAGLGSFDPMFRMHEPLALLKPTYFNHVHNDFIEILLDAGAPGLALLVAAIGWWFVASVRAWRAADMMPRVGSATVLLVLVASLFDYPARTPLIMVLIVVGGLWLTSKSPPPALPRSDEHL